MFFQETTPDTSGYMIAGYVTAFIVMGLYVLSLYLRSRNLHQDLTMFQEMENSNAGLEGASEHQARHVRANPETENQPKL